MTQTPAGWYSDPSPQNVDGHGQRFWDGSTWTDHVHHPGYSAAPRYAYAAPVKPTTPDGVELAGWWPRVFAIWIDGLIQLPLIALALIPIVASQWDELGNWFSERFDTGASGDPFSGMFDVPDIFNPLTGPGLASLAAGTAISVLYNVAFLRWKQATPGKLVVGLRVRLRESPDLPWSAIWRRYGFVAAVSALGRIPLLGTVFLILSVVDDVWPLADGNRQALHDKLAGTNVVVHQR